MTLALLHHLVRLVQAARADQGIAPTDPELRDVGVGLAGDLEIRQRGLDLALLQRQDPEIMVGVGMRRLSVENGTIEPFGLGQPPGLMIGNGLLQLLS